MPTDLSTIDLATINVAHEVIVASIRSKVCQWEQESSDLATDGKLSNAVMVKNWAFSADILATTVSTEFSALFSQALSARMNWSSTRSVSDQLLDALNLEVAAAQS
ncbi:MAG: hypothetical protein FJ077_16955, partial [Cyanobacteria bacterium K_DeepCast_35m_m2_023]|nr:hypothetical protein [Cyanobacteria bacterium K_DeepCast_35m_m2_023]